MEDISAGLFVFEFICEIVPNAKMSHRNKLYEYCKKQAYNMVLNVNHAMENLLDDDGAFVWMEPCITLSLDF